jgi:hypothetical protein
VLEFKEKEIILTTGKRRERNHEHLTEELLLKDELV